MEFLVDTGSQSTLLHPDALGLLRITPNEGLFRQAASTSRGLGGRHSHFIDACDLFLRNDDGEYDRLTLPIRFARPTLANATLPSLLGSDVLHHYRMTFEPAANIFTLELHSLRTPRVQPTHV